MKVGIDRIEFHRIERKTQYFNWTGERRQFQQQQQQQMCKSNEMSIRTVLCGFV